MFYYRCFLIFANASRLVRKAHQILNAVIRHVASADDPMDVEIVVFYPNSFIFLLIT